MARPFNPYKTTLRTEPDMRQEMINTLQGSYPEIAKKQVHVLRKMRTGTDGKLINCSCVDVLTKEPDKDHFCPICFGEGYIWSEILVEGYKVIIGSSAGLATKENLIGPGLTDLACVTFYFDWKLPLTLFPKRKSPDKIVEIMTGKDGQPIRPYQRDTIYRIGTAIDFRAEHGKLNYYRVDCYEEQVKFLNGPLG